MRVHSPGGAHSSRRQGDADHRPVRRARRRRGTGRTSSVSDVRTCQLKLPGVRMSSARRGGGHVDHQLVDARIDHQHQRGVRRGRADQPGAGLVDGQPQVGHRVEVEILGGRQGADQRCAPRRGSRAGRTPASRRNAGCAHGACSALSALDIGWPPGDIDPRLPQRDCQLIIRDRPGVVCEVMVCVRIPGSGVGQTSPPEYVALHDRSGGKGPRRRPGDVDRAPRRTSRRTPPCHWRRSGRLAGAANSICLTPTRRTALTEGLARYPPGHGSRSVRPVSEAVAHRRVRRSRTRSSVETRGTGQLQYGCGPTPFVRWQERRRVRVPRRPDRDRTQKPAKGLASADIRTSAQAMLRDH